MLFWDAHVVGFVLALCLRIKLLWLRLGGYTLLACTLVTFESMRGFFEVGESVILRQAVEV